MIKVLYITDTIRQLAEFINGLISNLQELGIKNIELDKQNNIITIGNIEVIGLWVYDSGLCIKMGDIKYFIDGIDINNRKYTDNRQLGGMMYHAREIMSHFDKDTKQLDSKDELIRIIEENVK